MLIRISLIIAAVVGLGVTALNLSMLKQKITTLHASWKSEEELHKKFESDYRRTKSDLEKTNAVLKTTQETLKVTDEEKTKAVEEATAQQKRADKLNEDLTKTRKERDYAQAEVAAYHAAGMTPQQVATATKDINRLQDNIAAMNTENKLLSQKLKKTENELAIYKTEDHHVLLPANLNGKVVVSDPKWNFVVLNIGEDQGVLQYGELLVNRNGRLVAKVRVSAVEKNRSVANIMPGWQLGEVMEGDLVIPAYPAS